MISTLTAVHVIVCILLIILVLLQFGKGAETGLLDAASGGTNFGPKGNILSKTTVVLSILFLGLCIALAKLRSQQVQESIFDDQAAKAKQLNMGTGDSLNKDTKPKGAAEPAPLNEAVKEKADEVKNKAQDIMKKATDTVKEKTGMVKEAASEGTKSVKEQAEKAVDALKTE